MQDTILNKQSEGFMEKDKEDPMEGVFGLIGIAQSHIHANRAEKLCNKLLENFNSLSEEQKEIERMFFKMITENVSFEDFVKMNTKEQDIFMSNLASKITVN